MNYNLDLKKLVEDVKGPKGLHALSEELTKITGELKKLTDEVKPKAAKSLKDAEARVNRLAKEVKATQGQLEKELAKYKKLALAQRAKLSKIFVGKKKTTKKVASTVRRKKTVRAATTTKKAAN